MSGFDTEKLIEARDLANDEMLKIQQQMARLDYFRDNFGNLPAPFVDVEAALSRQESSWKAARDWAHSQLSLQP